LAQPGKWTVGALVNNVWSFAGQSQRPPTGKESNWIQTVPGKGWFIMLRLYSPLEPWFDKTWRPGEIEPMK
jgi:hypothetical protein